MKVDYFSDVVAWFATVLLSVFGLVFVACLLAVAYLAFYAIFDPKTYRRWHEESRNG